MYWDRTRYIAWSSGNFKAKKPTDMFELWTDSINKKKHKRNEDAAKAAFDKYKKIDGPQHNI